MKKRICKYLLLFLKLIFSLLIGLFYGFVLLVSKQQIKTQYEKSMHLWNVVEGKNNKFECFPDVLITMFAFVFGGFKKSSREILRDEIYALTTESYRNFLWATCNKYGYYTNLIEYISLDYELNKFKKIAEVYGGDHKIKIGQKDIYKVDTVIDTLKNSLFQRNKNMKKLEDYIKKNYYFGFKMEFDAVVDEIKTN